MGTCGLVQSRHNANETVLYIINVYIISSQGSEMLTNINEGGKVESLRSFRMESELFAVSSKGLADQEKWTTTLNTSEKRRN